MPQFCVQFYANYTILATQRGAVAQWPLSKYAPGLDLFFFFRKPGNLANPFADSWNGFYYHHRYRSSPFLGFKDEAAENEEKMIKDSK